MSPRQDQWRKAVDAGIAKRVAVFRTLEDAIKAIRHG